jgi:DNA-binding MarR family transcriptional regulator
MATLQGDSPEVAPATGNEEQLAAEWHELLGRYHKTQCALDRALVHDHGLSVSDFEILQQLHAADDQVVRMHDLGEHVHLTQSALSRLITRLEKAGLVIRDVCTDDRRAVWTQITEAGKARYLAARPTHRLILKQYADGCTPAPGECVDADAHADLA